MKRFFALAILCVALFALTGCGGVPLRSVPRLLQLQSQLLEANPAEFMVALQVDARLTPPAGVVPLLVINVTPREPGLREGSALWRGPGPAVALAGAND